MAAGGAARRIAPWAGASGIVPYASSYVYTSTTDHLNQKVPGATATILPGPGTITSIRFIANAVIGIGFQVIGFDHNGNPTPLLQATPGTQVQPVTVAAIGAVGPWLTDDQARNPLMGPAYVYPIQEVINNGNTQLAFADGGGPGNSDVAPQVWNQYLNTQTFTFGQVFSFSNSFANGSFSAGDTGGTGAINVASITYSYYAPITYESDVRILVSPAILWHDQSGQAPPPSVTLQANVAFGVP